MDKKDKKIKEMEDLIAQLNADKNYFEKELIDMQIKQDDIMEDLKTKDSTNSGLQDEIILLNSQIDSQNSRLISLESGMINFRESVGERT